MNGKDPGSRLFAQADEQAAALEIARELTRHGIPVRVARRALDERKMWDPNGGTNGAGFRLPQGWEKSTPDPTFVDAWRPGDALIAVMGHGLDLIDHDPRNGSEASEPELDDIYPDIYAQAGTPSGGVHNFVASLKVRSRDNIRPGIDVKAGVGGQGHGFAFIAPTVKLSKTTGQMMAYRWQVPPDFTKLAKRAEDASGTAFAEMVAAAHGAKGPKSADKKTQATPAPRQTSARTFTPKSAQAYWETALETLRQATVGEINTRLNEAAYCLAHFVPEFVDHAQAQRLLDDALRFTAYDAKTWKAEDTIASGLAASTWKATRAATAPPVDQAAEARELIATIAGPEATGEPRPKTSTVDVDGATVLDRVHDFIRRFLVLPTPGAYIALTLWVAMSHMVEHFHSVPRLAVISPEKGSGKTRVLELLNLLTPAPMFVFGASVASIFRTLDEGQVTLLFDEVDTVFKGGKDDKNEDLRALLNMGYKRGATIPRCVPPDWAVKHFHVFGAVALAAIGKLPDTVMSRSVILRMRRRAPDEKIERFRLRVQEGPGHALRDELAGWAGQVGKDAGQAWPQLPADIEDRPVECWEPLLAVADQAGGHWPAAARAACVQLCQVAADLDVSLGLRLLADLRTVFADADVMATGDILTGLSAMDEAPWADLYGKPIDARKLAEMLRRYEVESKTVRIGTKTPKGYRRESLADLWRRYLPHGGAATSATSDTSQLRGVAEDKTETQHPQHDHGIQDHVALCCGSVADAKVPLTRNVADVADVAAPPWGGAAPTTAIAQATSDLGYCGTCGMNTPKHTKSCKNAEDTADTARNRTHERRTT